MTLNETCIELMNLGLSTGHADSFEELMGELVPQIAELIQSTKEKSMETYIGTKLVNATPMNRADYNEYRGWELPADEDGSDPGYLVEYIDGGESNHANHAGYISWSPSDVFDRAYKKLADGFDFGMALAAIKKGKKVARVGWNGSGMFVFLVPGSRFEVNRAPLLGIYPEGTEVTYQPHIDMKTAQGTVVPWLASQSDLLAEDWFIIE